MFWGHENINKIMADPLVVADGHSGASMAWAFRYMERIMKKGWEKTVKDNIEVYIDVNG